ncbi:hypothetical protein [Corallococcus exiguus]|uniref:hypothetical protein n=1 Tax=Corallococcus exiguus TaxID=83462 RepID=UPI001F5EBEC9|nr:hypothetical protein [Corallococcus exiguus]
MVLAVVVALGFGLFFTTSLVQRALRPVSVLSQAVRRLGHGRRGGARRWWRDGTKSPGSRGTSTPWRSGWRSTARAGLGELLQAQAVSQAAIDSLPDPVLVLGAEGGLPT